MILNRRGTLLLMGGLIAFPALLVLLAIVSRDAYPGPNVPASPLILGGALVAACASTRLLRNLRKPLENPLKHTLGTLILGAVLGGCTVSLVLDTFVRFTVRQLHTGWVTYAITPGWKHCRFGVTFEDPVLLAHIRVCGPRWELPATPDTGALLVVETSGPYGVVLPQVTTGTQSGR